MGRVIRSWPRQTLVKKLPPPLRRPVGDLSDKERVLVGLDLRKKE